MIYLVFFHLTLFFSTRLSLPINWPYRLSNESSSSQLLVTRIQNILSNQVLELITYQLPELYLQPISMHSSSLLALAALASFPPSSAHMVMSDPAPIKYPKNPNTQNADYSYISPLNADGSDFPCKGYAELMDTPEGKSVASWATGSSQHITIEGGAS